MEIPEYLLIIAGSGRMLAQAAHNAGLNALVIDLYADQDTRGHAVAVRRVPSLELAHIAPAVDEFIERYGVEHVIYGSGFECCPESLVYLNQRLTILGNRPEVFIRLQDKAGFFSVLAELKISYPEVAFTAPGEGGDWLVKPMRGQGGFGIKRCAGHQQSAPGIYWQKLQPGTTCSALFLADGRQARVVGFNTQWTAGLAENNEFVFAGVINHAGLDAAQQSKITDWLAKCVQAFALKGLNSLDFINDGEQSYVLEINPRPSASMQLYDDLLIRHVAASRGVMPDHLLNQTGLKGYKIVYADRDLLIPDRFDWPDGSMDRPEAGVLCRTGQPICSIIAHQNGSRQVLEQLAIRQQQIVNQLNKVQPHGI